jgi:hypothetical protein
MLYIYTLPESRRYLLRKANDCDNKMVKTKLYKQAFDSPKQLNKSPLQAGPEMIWLYYSLKEESKVEVSGFPRIANLWKDARTRRALIPSILVIFMQQFCGVNMIAYYSTSLLQRKTMDRDEILPGDKPDPFYVSPLQ